MTMTYEDDDDGLTIDDVIEDDELTRATGLAVALLAPATSIAYQLRLIASVPCFGNATTRALSIWC